MPTIRALRKVNDDAPAHASPPLPPRLLHLPATNNTAPVTQKNTPTIARLSKKDANASCSATPATTAGMVATPTSQNSLDPALPFLPMGS